MFASKWLEWSTTRLAPALVHNFAVGHQADPNAKPVLNLLVKTLNDTLSSSLYLTGPYLTCADVAVWSLLIPDGTLKGAQNIDNLLIWYKTISILTEVTVSFIYTPILSYLKWFFAHKASLDILPVKDLHFASLQQSNKFGGLNHVVLVPKVGEETVVLAAESPNQIADSVTSDEQGLATKNFIYVPPAIEKEPRTV